MSLSPTPIGSDEMSERPVRLTTCRTSGSSMIASSIRRTVSSDWASDTEGIWNGCTTIEPSSIVGRNSVPSVGARAAATASSTSAPPTTTQGDSAPTECGR